jgi:hypothetical protein
MHTLPTAKHESERRQGDMDFVFDDPTASSGAEVHPDGSYELDLQPGARQVRARYTDTPASAGWTTVDVVAGRTTSHDLRLPDDAPILLEGTVFEPDGAPSIGASVSAHDERGWSPSYQHATTDEEGHFTIREPNWPAGRRIVADARNDSRMASVASILPGTRSVAITLRAPASLRGRVIGSKPVSGFKLSISGSPAVEAEFAGDTFEVYDVPPGRVLVTASAGEAGTGSALANVEPGAEASVDIHLIEAGRAFGKLVNASTQDGFASYCNVTAKNLAGYSAGLGHCAKDGSFEVTDLPTGDYVLSFAMGGGYTERPVTIAGGQAVDLGDINIDGFRAPPGKVGLSPQDREHGVYVASVAKDGPAEKAGIKEGDRIVAVDGVPIDSTDEMLKRVPGKPGTQVSITIRRGDQEQVLTMVRAR